MQRVSPTTWCAALRGGAPFAEPSESDGRGLGVQLEIPRCQTSNSNNSNNFNRREAEHTQ